MPKKGIRTSLSGAPLAVSHDEPIDPLMEADSASTGDLARCTQWFALSAEMRPQYRSALAATDPSIAATASADRGVEPADATRLLNLRAIIPLAQQ